MSSPDTTLPEMKPLDWLRSPLTMLPVPVPEAELSSPDTSVAGDEAARLVAVAVDDIAGAGA